MPNKKNSTATKRTVNKAKKSEPIFMETEETSEINETRLSSCPVNIKVMGVGGAGNNAIGHMINMGIDTSNIELMCANTDIQDLEKIAAPTSIQLGKRGLGAGSDPLEGAKAAEESRNEIEAHIGDANILFIAAGMGGGTGTGAAPIIAEIAREKGILTVGVVNTPFPNEGGARLKNADFGLANLDEQTNALVVLPNAKLMEADRKMPLSKRFEASNMVLYKAIQSITDLLIYTGEINLDFADLTKVLKNGGKAMMGRGMASGEGRCRNALDQALNNPLLDRTELGTCSTALVNITFGDDITAPEFDEINRQIRHQLGMEDNEKEDYFPGLVEKEDLGNTLEITVIACQGDSSASGVVGKQPEQKLTEITEQHLLGGVAAATVGQESKDEDIDYETPAYIRMRRRRG